MKDLILKIKEVPENGTVFLNPGLILWREGRNYNLETINKQFDDLEKMLSKLSDKPFYLIDLSVAKRPTPEVVSLIERRIKPLKDNFKHVAVYTGKNYVIYLGIKFYFIRFGFPSYSAHASLQSALKTLEQ